jgi:hypothetical protein
MPFRQTIAGKIFGLAIILLLLTIALAGFLMLEVARTKQDLRGGRRFRCAAHKNVRANG